MLKNSRYSSLNQLLQQAEIGINPAELHGFLTGLICGNVADEQWQSLLFKFTNDDQAYPATLMESSESLFQDTQNLLRNPLSFNFRLFLPNNETTCEDVFAQADALSGWINHFLLGLGLMQKDLDKQTGEVGEGLDDLQEIAKLSYDEDEDKQELADAVEEVIDYISATVLLFYVHFCAKYNSIQDNPTLH